MVVDVAELLGVTVFALSGGLLAARRGMDLFGAVVLALVAGLGGGTIRDVLLGATPPANLSDVWALGCATVRRGRGVLLGPGAGRSSAGRCSCWTPGGLGLFTVNGAVTALTLGAPPLAAVFLGLLTGIGGGRAAGRARRAGPGGAAGRHLRPAVSLAGSVAVVLLWRADAFTPVAGVLVAALVFAVRLLGRMRRWHLRRTTTEPPAWPERPARSG